MRVGVDRNKYQIQIPLPPKIDPTVTMMTVEEKPDITYNDIGGNKDEIQKLREVLELPMLHPEPAAAAVRAALAAPARRRVAARVRGPRAAAARALPPSSRRSAAAK